ncbi:hypothetical protein CPSG_07625 [Coccidioides posadasii str. Silveira]|uniref:Uncharacterized protein n=1 Tax=Coccidioides posadasii (strain RMSCC 757 / Silveira) TaxID=443226 RepID=E9DCS3_COCPS|nr:hypothetical protein CPSG_07625 [Coccidioides posadasii str. Silveira]
MTLQLSLPILFPAERFHRWFNHPVGYPPSTIPNSARDLWVALAYRLLLLQVPLQKTNLCRSKIFQPFSNWLEFSSKTESCHRCTIVSKNTPSKNPPPSYSALDIQPRQSRPFPSWTTAFRCLLPLKIALLSIAIPTSRVRRPILGLVWFFRHNLFSLALVPGGLSR